MTYNPKKPFRQHPAPGQPAQIKDGSDMKTRASMDSEAEYISLSGGRILAKKI